MRIRKKKDALVQGAFLIGIACILYAVIMCIYSDSAISCFFGDAGDVIWFGLIAVVYGLYVKSKSETEILPDERTYVNAQKAGFHAFWILMASLGLLFFVAETGLYLLGLIDVLLATILIGMFSYFMLDFHYNKIGLGHVIRTIKENKILFYFGILFSIICLVGAIMVIFFLFFFDSIVPDNLENLGFVDYADVLKADSNFSGSGNNFIEYMDIESAKQALIDGNIFLFFVAHEDYIETGRITVYSKEGIYSDFIPTTIIEGFLRRNLLSYANVSDEIILKFESPEITGEEIEYLLKQANISYEISQRIQNSMIAEKIIVKNGDLI